MFPSTDSLKVLEEKALSHQRPQINSMETSTSKGELTHKSFRPNRMTFKGGKKGTKKKFILVANLSSQRAIFLKGQLQRFHKLISNDRIWPSEHGFEVIFEKSLFVFEISAFKVRNKRGIHSRFHSFSENNNRETFMETTCILQITSAK